MYFIMWVQPHWNCSIPCSLRWICWSCSWQRAITLASAHSQFLYSSHHTGGFPGASIVKNLPATQETWFDPAVRKIPWRRKWQATPVFLPGECPWTEEPGRLQSMGLQRVGDNWINNLNIFIVSKERTSRFLFLESPFWNVCNRLDCQTPHFTPQDLYKPFQVLHISELDLHRLLPASYSTGQKPWHKCW